MSPLRRAQHWLEERTGALTAWRHVADEPVHGGPRWAYVLGSVLLFLAAAQLLSGVALAFEYAPTTSAAWESLARVMDPGQSPWGRVVRGLHHHGASLMVIVLVAHVVQVALFGAHRRPREANWLTGMALGLVVLALGFTGYLLPWDQTAFYATRVGINIVRSTPVVGAPIAELLQGGPILGNLTLTRFYVLHVVLLPGALLLLVVVHLVLFRRHGVTARASGATPARAEPFWPRQALRDVLAMLAACALLLLAAWLLPVELGEKADPSRPFDARPEWYFLWLFQLLRWFEPPWELVGSLVIPGLVGLYFALQPWLDRRGPGEPRSRRPAFLGLLCALGGMALLTVQVVVGDALRAEAEPGGEEAAPVAPAPISPVEAGMIYGERCTECHRIDGSPEDPDARDFRSPEFKRMARNDFQALVRAVQEGGDIMPAFEGELTPAQIHGVLTQVVLQFPELREAPGDAPTDAGPPDGGGP
jgi:ubiquinol-cytochrome c reductase cytochrome b subunit